MVKYLDTKIVTMKKLLFIFLVFSACYNFDMADIDKTIDDEETMEDSLTLNYLALGDSYTIGHGVPDEDRFPNQLMASAFSKPHEIGEFKIIARTGWTTRNLLDAMDRDSLKTGAYDFITLLIGVNNQFQGKPIDQYVEEFNILMDRSIALLEGDASRLIVVSIPDYGVTPFGLSRNPEKIAAEIDNYNEINKNIAQERNAHYVYITDLTKAAKDDLTLLASDQLHPSGKSYAQWVERIIPEVNKILESF